MWKFVYPGRWTAKIPANGLTTVWPSVTYPFHQEGVAYATWNPTATTNKVDPWIVTPPGYAPTASSGTALALSAKISFGAAALTSSYLNGFSPIQINNTDMGGPHKLYTGVNQTIPYSSATSFGFPFGGFARIGDVLQVPFIGAYTITTGPLSSPTIVEMNPITADCAFADDNDTTQVVFPTVAGGGAACGAAQVSAAGWPAPSNNVSDDYIEQVGRFCPLMYAQQPYNSSQSTLSTNSPPLETFYNINSADPYGWASHILNYFTTIQNPHDDYLPNVNPYPTGSAAQTGANPVGGTYAAWNNLAGTNPATPPTALGYKQPAISPSVQAVPNIQGAKPTNANHIKPEDGAGVDGLININTANIRTLAAVPWVPLAGGNNTNAIGSNASWSQNAQVNYNLAASIVNYRNMYGPFRTLFELNRVVAGGLSTYTASAITPGNNFMAFFGDPTWTGGYNDRVSTMPQPNYLAGYIENFRGDISPLQGAIPSTPPLTNSYISQDPTPNHYETRFATLTRVSNLITTRSDTYTVYVLVQG